MVSGFFRTAVGFSWGFTGTYNFLMTLQILRRNGVLMMQVCWKKGGREIYCIWKENLKLRKHEDPRSKQLKFQTQVSECRCENDSKPYKP